MSENNIDISVFRFDPGQDREPKYQQYAVPFTTGMSVMDALDYVYQNLDSTLAYYDHAGCSLGICARCVLKLNGKNCVSCQTPLPESGTVTIEPSNMKSVLKDLVVKRKGEE